MSNTACGGSVGTGDHWWEHCGKVTIFCKCLVVIWSLSFQLIVQPGHYYGPSKSVYHNFACQ